MRRVLSTFGTRPEAIKMAPVVAAVAEDAALEGRVCVTAQHRGLLDQVLDLFGIVPDVDLDLMRHDQKLADLTSRVLLRMTETLGEGPVDAVLVHGDTTTAMATALAAFYLEIPVGHVEAGLRSGRMDAPFPEEMNRVVIDRLARWRFAPTPGAAAHLAAEGVDPATVHVTGNTAIDALLQIRDRLPGLRVPVRDRVGEDGRLLLVTAHRRESFGAPLAAAFDAIAEVARRHPDVRVVYPVHPNPNVLGPARERLGGLANVALIEPVGYAELVWLLDRASLVLTDSGGIQEEGATLGRPLLVLREVTERPELVEAGAGLLVGCDHDRIVAEACRLLDDPAAARAMARPRALFGDGRAARRIAAVLADRAVPDWVPEAAA